MCLSIASISIVPATLIVFSIIFPFSSIGIVMLPHNGGISEIKIKLEFAILNALYCCNIAFNICSENPNSFS